MNPRVIKVTALQNYQLELVFNNNEIKVFDASLYLDKGIFTELKNYEFFKKVRVFMGSVAWPSGQDFCPDTLYEQSTKIN
jgi:hypothetical protein